ncbi:MAG: HAMP domain-containing histidine kinase [Oscillospiraceae bacterium]|nr:HAMP domain-containing histidine kinase [Oscillospiraceae bacterium]
MIERLRKRFIRIAVLSVALVMLLLSVVVNVSNYLSVNADIDSLLEMLSDDGRPGAAPHSGGDNHGMMREDAQRPDGEAGWFDGRGGKRFNPETPFSTRYFVLYFDEQGELQANDLAHIAAVEEDEISEYLAVAVKSGEGSAYYGGYKYLVTAQRNGGYKAVFMDCYSQLRSVRMVALLTFAADAVCLLLVYGLVVVFSKKAIDPVVRSAKQQKQFITDASHELKTPLTVMRTSLKVLEMETGHSKWIDKANSQTDKMTELVNSLVTLSRMDEEEPPVALADFDLSAAVGETVESFLDSAAAEGHPIKTDIADGVVFRGDETMIRQLCSILLDNALKYALPGGEITLSLKREHRGIVLRQSNPCEEIAESDLEKLFDRFYRADPSRSSERKGFGVGLSIARGIVEAHKGKISASCPENGIIEFTVVLK